MHFPFLKYKIVHASIGESGVKVNCYYPVGFLPKTNKKQKKFYCLGNTAKKQWWHSLLLRKRAHDFDFDVRGQKFWSGINFFFFTWLWMQSREPKAKKLWPRRPSQHVFSTLVEMLERKESSFKPLEFWVSLRSKIISCPIMNILCLYMEYLCAWICAECCWWWLIK